MLTGIRGIVLTNVLRQQRAMHPLLMSVSWYMRQSAHKHPSSLNQRNLEIVFATEPCAGPFLIATVPFDLAEPAIRLNFHYHADLGVLAFVQVFVFWSISQADRQFHKQIFVCGKNTLKDDERLCDNPCNSLLALGRESSRTSPSLRQLDSKPNLGGIQTRVRPYQNLLFFYLVDCNLCFTNLSHHLLLISVI